MRFYVKTAVAGALALAVIGGSLVSQAKKNTETKMPGMDRSTTLELRVPRPYAKGTVETRIERDFVSDDTPDDDTWLEGQLTVEEKAQLERTEAKTAPLYKQMDGIEAEISKITERILGKYNNGEEQLNALYARHNELWEKLDSNSTEQEWEMSAKDRIRGQFPFFLCRIAVELFPQFIVSRVQCVQLFLSVVVLAQNTLRNF